MGLRRGVAGLTLVELAVVIVLMAISATVAVPWFADQIARQRLRAAAEALAVDLQEVRHAAAHQGRPLHLSFAGGPDWCWARTTTPDCDCKVPQPCRSRAVGPADHRGVLLTTAQNASFDPTGTGRGSAELHSSRGQVLRVEVGPMGRTRICSPGGADPRLPAC